MNIKITKNLRLANAITHRGCFHADEIFATVVLMSILEEVILARVDLDELKQNLPQYPIIYDIGGGPFDHHQPGGNGQRENTIKYSSFGLIWRAFGRRVLEERYHCSAKDANILYETIDFEFVQAIDASDNNQIIRLGCGFPVMGIPSMISSFYPSWNSAESEDDAFLEALYFASRIFDNVVTKAVAKLEAKSSIERAIKYSSHNVLLLDQFLPWKDWLLNSNNPKAKDIQFVVCPSNRIDGYNIMGVPIRVGSRYLKKYLPEKWAGLSGSDLVKASGVEMANFCHPARFIATAKSLDGAMQMAHKAIEFEER
ncbi:MAG: MYG1 family protein [Clostridia bacterium]|nr:MYG1 family protein [Clostridia bacterium]